MNPMVMDATTDCCRNPNLIWHQKTSLTLIIKHEDGFKNLRMCTTQTTSLPTYMLWQITLVSSWWYMEALSALPSRGWRNTMTPWPNNIFEQPIIKYRMLCAKSWRRETDLTIWVIMSSGRSASKPPAPTALKLATKEWHAKRSTITVTVHAIEHT